MSERKVNEEIEQERNTNIINSIDEDEIIDVSVLNFETDEWCCKPIQCSTESRVDDLYTWLKSDPDIASPVNRKCIDTRTFTRPKKRSCRTSFDSILETLTPPAPKTHCSDFMNIEEDVDRSQDLLPGNKKDVVPAMLKLASTRTAHLLSDDILSLGRESMEGFLNKAPSRDIDSWDPLMNISQPSLLYSSITSMPQEDGASENLYETMTYHVDKSDLSNSANETFSRTACNMSESFGMLDLNGTYNMELAGRTLTLSGASLNKTSTIDSSSSCVDDGLANATVVKPQTREKKDLPFLDSTHLLPQSEELLIASDATYMSPGIEKNSNVLNSTYLSPAIEKNSNALDATYSSSGTEKKDKDANVTVSIGTRKEETRVYDTCRNIITSNTPANVRESPASVKNSTFSFANENNLDSTFNLSISHCHHSTPQAVGMLHSTPQLLHSTPQVLNSTFNTSAKQPDQSEACNAASSTPFHKPTSLRRELLAEVRRTSLDPPYNNVGEKKHFSEKNRTESVDLTCDRDIKNDIPVENKYNTYRKEPATDRIKYQVKSSDGNKDAQADRRFYTFAKKSSLLRGKTDMESTESLENVDATFVKSFDKTQKRKPNIPRPFSKVPQFLQKSNPNLVSNSLKTADTRVSTSSAGMGYSKGSQPNITRDVDKSMASKLYSLGKMRSGSEQRLNVNADFQTLGAGGSTESIESTQSAHSAPDLDDRLSTCSDSSHNSYTAQTMNIEQLHQIVRMQEESLKQDTTPKLTRRVLENTWINGKKDLPSPIPENGCEGGGSGSSSPLSMDHTVSTSSPLQQSLSPASHCVTNDGRAVDNVAKTQSELGVVRNVEVFKKPAERVENKTRLRQPSNWRAGSRQSVLSAIPKPLSRIPGPRFARPLPKATQGDVKQGTCEFAKAYTGIPGKRY